MNFKIFKLNFINKTENQNNFDVLFFQKNIALDNDENAVAWKVIKNCTAGSNHLFTFPREILVSVSDSLETEIITPTLALDGQILRIYKDNSGYQLSSYDSGAKGKDIEIRNELISESINIKIYKDGRVLSVKVGVLIEQKAIFQFNSNLWLGVVHGFQEGQVLNSAIRSRINTELNLSGIASADIVMTDMGPGARSIYVFDLENIVYV